MDALLIGGTGLISTGITRQLVADGHDVTCYTRGESEPRVPESVEFIEGDRYDDEHLAKTAREEEPDAVIDMVCYGPDAAEGAVEAFAGHTDQYVFCSTVDVYYRPPANNPVTEDAQRHDEEHFVSEYGKNKTECEDVFMAAAEDGAFETTVIRPWHTYGEGGRINHTFGSDTYYISRIEEGEPVVVQGDGSALWGPCHRDDVAVAFANSVGNEDAYGEAYHVTGDQSFTWDQYHQRVAEALDAPEPELVHIPTDVLLEVAPEKTDFLRDHFQYATVFDNAKAKRDLDFEHTISWEEGVARTVAWLKENEGLQGPHEGVGAFEDELVEKWRDSVAELAGSLNEQGR